jgi:hypothetical protein
MAKSPIHNPRTNNTGRMAFAAAAALHYPGSNILTASM